jgi:cation transport protein ChaC
VYSASNKVLFESTIIYVANSKNVSFLGPKGINDIAKQIAGSIGPSGNNRDYLFGLDEALRIIAPETPDEHVQELTEV